MEKCRRLSISAYAKAFRCTSCETCAHPLPRVSMLLVAAIHLRRWYLPEVKEIPPARCSMPVRRTTVADYRASVCSKIGPPLPNRMLNTQLSYWQLAQPLGKRRTSSWSRVHITSHGAWLISRGFSRMSMLLAPVTQKQSNVIGGR